MSYGDGKQRKHIASGSVASAPISSNSSSSSASNPPNPNSSTSTSTTGSGNPNLTPGSGSVGGSSSGSGNTATGKEIARRQEDEVIMVLNAVAHFSKKNLIEFDPTLYESVSNLLEGESIEIRKEVRTQK